MQSCLTEVEGEVCMFGVYLQAVDYGSPLSLLSLALPLVNLQDQFEEGPFGGGDFSVSGPSQVLELTNHQVALLRLKYPTEHMQKNAFS